MKKISVLVIISLVLGAGSAFAGNIPAGQVITASVTDANGTYTLGPATGGAFAKLSTGVSLGYLTSAGTYAIVTKHVNGDTEYGAAANDGKNYYQSKPVNSTADAPSASDSTAFSGWSSL